MKSVGDSIHWLQVLLRFPGFPPLVVEVRWMAPKWTGFRPYGRLLICRDVACKGKIWNYGGGPLECFDCGGPTKFARNRWFMRMHKRGCVVRGIGGCTRARAVRQAMAFQSGRKGAWCAECKVECKFFKMFQSFRPHHAWTDESGRTMGVLFCI